MPKTFLGKLSLGLIIVFFLLFAVFQLFVTSGQRGGETYFSNLLLAIPITLAGISGIAAFFTGITALVKRKERSIAVYIAVLIGFFVLLFVLGEILYPH